MGTGLRIEVLDGQRRSVERFELRSFPVRFGREPLMNEVPLKYGFVSSYHARVDFVEQRLSVRDIGSRNGVCVDGRRIPQNQAVDLAQHGNEFSIGELTIALEVAELPDEPSDGQLRSSITGKLVQTARVHESANIARGMEAQLVAGEFEGMVDGYRRAWGAVRDSLSRRLAGMTPDASAALLDRVIQAHPSLAREPEFQQLAEHYGVHAGRAREEKRALEVMQELAGFFLDRPLRTEADIAAFGVKIRQALETFVATFIPLRDGLRAFERDVVQENVRRPNPFETPKSLAEVATLLLDWKERADRSQALRSVFADILSHQVSMLAGVMDGVRALLDEISPKRIEEELTTSLRRSKGGLVSWPFRTAALWREYKARHRDFAIEESHSFRVVFGSEFAAAYLRHFGSVTADIAEAVAQPAPPAGLPVEAPPEAPTPMPVVASRVLPTVGKTPETHGFPKPKIGPTGTAIGRTPRPLPNSGPMVPRAAPTAPPSEDSGTPLSRKQG